MEHKNVIDGVEREYQSRLPPVHHHPIFNFQIISGVMIVGDATIPLINPNC